MADISSDRQDDQRLNSSKSSEWVEMNEEHLNNTDDSLQQQSRFHVAKVSDEKRDHTDETNEETIDGDEATSPVGSAVQRTYGNTASYYDTKNMKSLRYYTREALPRADHYRNILSVHGHLSRPTLDELHGVQATIPAETNRVRCSKL